MSDASDIGLQTAKEMLDDSGISRLQGSDGSNGSGAKLGELSLEFVFGKVWTRAGLSRRDRSLATLGILIALRQSEELKIHTLAVSAQWRHSAGNRRSAVPGVRLAGFSGRSVRIGHDHRYAA